MAILLYVYFFFYWRNSFLFGLAPFDGDMLFHFYPTWQIGKNLLSSDFHLLWDPFRNMGQPFLASPSNQALYPLRFFSIFLDFIDYSRLFLLFHTLLAFVFSFLLARKWVGDTVSAFYAGLVFSFGGTMFWRVLYQSDFATMAWIPGILFFLLTNRASWLGVFLSLQWMAGFPPFVIFTYLLMFILILVSESKKEKWICFAKGVLLAGGLAAVQLLPFIELLKETYRPLFLHPEVATELSVHPLSIVEQLLYPSFLLLKAEHMTVGIKGFYIGPIVTGLFIFGLWKGRRTEKIIGGAALVCLALTMGKWIPFYHLLPGTNIIRFPVQWILVFVVLMTLVSAYGLTLLKKTGVKVGLVFLVALDLLIMAHQLEFAWGNKNFFTTPPAQLQLNNPSTRAHRFFHTDRIMDNKNKWVYQSLESWHFLREIYIPSYGASFGIRETISHYPLTTRRAFDFQNKLNTEDASDLFSLADIGTIFDMKPGTEKKLSPTLADHRLIKNTNPYGRAFLENRKTPVLIQRDAPGDFVVEATGPGRLIFSEAMYPGWQAHIDGKKTNLEAFQDMFLSVTLPEGPHVIHFRYRPRSFFIGFGLTLGTLLFIFIRFALSRFRRRSFH